MNTKMENKNVGKEIDFVIVVVNRCFCYKNPDGFLRIFDLSMLYLYEFSFGRIILDLAYPSIVKVPKRNLLMKFIYCNSEISLPCFQQ